MLCLDCFMYKCISNWFRHVQGAPTLLIVELEMAYPDERSGILEQIIPAQGRINSQHCTRVIVLLVLVASQCHVTLGDHWQTTGTATFGGVAVLRPQTYVSNPYPSLVVPDTPAGLIPSSLGKHPPPLSFYCIPDIHFLKRPHLQLLAMRPHLQLLAIPGSKDEIQTKTMTREMWAGFLRSHCTQQRWSQGRLESDVNVPHST